MILIIGLGNPGKKFEKTKHNFGFLVLDEFFKKNKNFYNLSQFILTKEFNCLISEGKIEKKKIILAKPQTFMNDSGKAVRLLIANFKLKTENLLVIHDDLDIPLGKIKIVKNRGSAGHKGVQSIIDKLGTKNFVRFRIGIQSKKKEKKTENFVLQRFNKKEKKIVKEVIKKTIEAIEISLKEGVEKAMSQFNK